MGLGDRGLTFGRHCSPSSLALGRSFILESHVDRKIRRLHKACQLFKQVLAPELETIEALQGLPQACKAKTEIEGGYRVLWPLQYSFLLENNTVAWPPDERWGLSVDLVMSTSKADGLLKLFILGQVAWFTTNCVVRSVHGMALAPRESMTLAYVVQVILTYVFWWKKPKDITTATFVDLPEMDPDDRNVVNSLAMEHTYDVPDPGDVQQSKGIAWYIIPRDCGETDYRIAIEKAKALYGSSNGFSAEEDQADPEDGAFVTARALESPKSLTSTYEFKRARPLADMEPGLPGIKHGGCSRSQTTVITEWDDSLYWTKWWPLVCLVACSFGAVHMISWDGHFATSIELWLWRTSCVGSIVFALVTMQFKKVELRWHGGLVLVQLGCPVLYVVCRLIMLAEVVAAFRGMPASTYATYDVTNYWVHL